MKHTLIDGLLTVSPVGHIDTTNAPAVERDIFALIDANHPKSVVVDMTDLTYISSTGLRIMLKLRKRFSDLKVINVSSEVYEIFDVTGFSEMMTVEKAYRVIDVEGCDVIGEGANGKIYRINRDTIVKVNMRPDAIEDIKREREMARTAFVLGVPSAIPYDVVRVGEGYGSVFELLNAKSFAELLREDADNLEMIARESMSVAKILHSTPAPAILPFEDDIARGWLKMIRDYLTEEQYAKFNALIDALPKPGTMIHGDFHLKNIMSQNGETLLIDMDTLSNGHPIYELAYMYNAYRGFGIVDPGVIERFLGVSADLAYRLYRRSLAIYLETEDDRRIDEVEKKASLIGLLRVMRRVIRLGNQDTPDGRALIEACHARIVPLLEEVDSLAF
jgi:uncharacterized protein (TIGR02172 family)